MRGAGPRRLYTAKVPGDRVTYKELVGYVGSIVDPVKAHMEAHDVWHRDLAERDARRTRANMWTSVGLALTAAVGIADLIARLTGH